jgi:hypothetical protein
VGYKLRVVGLVFDKLRLTAAIFREFMLKTTTISIYNNHNRKHYCLPELVEGLIEVESCNLHPMPIELPTRNL